MNQSVPEHASGRYRFETLELATRRYRLRDPASTNTELAGRLGLNQNFHGDSLGTPDCCFFLNGDIVAIRTKTDEVAVFHVRQSIQREMEIIAERIS